MARRVVLLSLPLTCICVLIVSLLSAAAALADTTDPVVPSASPAPPTEPAPPDPPVEPAPPEPAPPAPQAQSPGGSVPVLGAAVLRSRSGGGRVIRTLRKGTQVRPICTAVGGLASVKPDGLSRLWVRVAVGGRRGWVHDARVNRMGGALIAPLCGVEVATGPALPTVTAGRCAVTPPVQLLPPFSTFNDFIAAALPGAVASWERSYVPVSVTIAQGILETGGGKYAALGNNYFGIKARERESSIYYWGPNAVGCTFTKTREAERRGLVMTVGAFRAYRSLSDSIMDHGFILTTNPVYARAFLYSNQPTRFLRTIARRYATDPSYANKLLSLISRYKLRTFDRVDRKAPKKPVPLPEAPATTTPTALPPAQPPPAGEQPPPTEPPPAAIA